MDDTKITLRHQVISPSLAHTILLKEMYEGERHLNQSYARQYGLAIRNEDFREGTLISFCVWQDRRYLINGQHTLTGIVLADRSYLLGIEEIRVDRYEDIAVWYSKYDRVNLRTLEDNYHAHNLQAQVQLNKGQTSQLGGCLPSLASGFEYVSKTQGSLRMYVANPDMRMAFIREWRDEAESFFRDIKGAPGRMNGNLRRGPVMALALVTYRYTGADAAEFWHAVAMDDRLAKNDIRKRLHMFVRISKVGEFAPYIFSRYMASAWCAAWEDRTPQSIVAQPAHLPIRIAGTPHTGEKVLRYISPQGDVLPDPQEYRPDVWHAGVFPPKDAHDA
jgi:hypothetical protein